MATKRKARRFDDGGDVREGRNENIGDDTRARAMAWVAKQLAAEEAAAKEAERGVVATPVREPSVTRRPLPAAPRVAAPAPRVAAPAPVRTPQKAADAAADEFYREARVGNDLDAARRFVGKRGASRYGDIVGKAMRQKAADAAADEFYREARIGNDPSAARRFVSKRGASRYGDAVSEAMPGGTVAEDGRNFKRGGKTKVTKMAKGGVVKSRGDGIAQRGRTKGRFVK